LRSGLSLYDSQGQKIQRIASMEAEDGTYALVLTKDGVYCYDECQEIGFDQEDILTEDSGTEEGTGGSGSEGDLE